MNQVFVILLLVGVPSFAVQRFAQRENLSIQFDGPRTMGVAIARVPRPMPLDTAVDWPDDYPEYTPENRAQVLRDEPRSSSSISDMDISTPASQWSTASTSADVLDVSRLRTTDLSPPPRRAKERSASIFGRKVTFTLNVPSQYFLSGRKRGLSRRRSFDRATDQRRSAIWDDDPSPPGLPVLGRSSTDPLPQAASTELEESLCGTCFQEMRPSQSARKTCCTSLIHQECLDGWLKMPLSRGRCPFCRNMLTSPVSEPARRRDEDLPEWGQMERDIQQAISVSFGTFSARQNVVEV